MRRGAKVALAVALTPLVGWTVGVVFIMQILLGDGAAAKSCHAVPEGSVANANQRAVAEIPHWLLPIYVGAAKKYHLGPAGWAVLASVNYQETAFGNDLSTSSKGAIGWMQFMPETWQKYGVTPNGKTAPLSDAYNPEDAIYTAAHYLHASGAPQNWSGALLIYNHSSEYVQQVLTRAREWLANPSELNFAPQGGKQDPVGESVTAENEEGGEQEVQLAGHAVVFKPRTRGLQILTRDPNTVGKVWFVSAAGHEVMARQVGTGPAPTHGEEPRIAVSPEVVTALGLTQGTFEHSEVSAWLEAQPGGGCEEGEGNAQPATAEAVEEAANKLAAMHLPYVWGGGHQSTPAQPSGGPPPGLDCSGSVSWVLQHAGFNIPTMVSGQFMHWGDPGPGKWITIFANPEHVFLRISSPRHPKPRYFGTGAWGSPYSGPEWFVDEPTQSWLDGFVEVHPPGL